MIREKGIIVPKDVLDSFNSRQTRLYTGQDAVIVGEIRESRPVEPYVKILCSKIQSTPNLTFDVRFEQTPTDGENSILKCNLELDDKGNVTGLSDDQFSAWLKHEGNTYYLIKYKVNSTRPDTADLVKVMRQKIRLPGEPINWDVDIDINKLGFDPANLGFPPSFDLIETLDMYLGQQPLTVDAILAQPLVPAAAPSF